MIREDQYFGSKEHEQNFIEMRVDIWVRIEDCHGRLITEELTRAIA